MAETVALTYDKAWLTVTSTMHSVVVDVFTQAAECANCPLRRVVAGLRPSQHSSLLANATYATLIAVRESVSDETETAQSLCDMKYHFGEYGSYELVISQASLTDRINTVCSVHEVISPVHSALPIYVAVFILAASTLLFRTAQIFLPAFRGAAVRVARNVAYRNRVSGNDPVRRSRSLQHEVDTSVAVNSTEFLVGAENNNDIPTVMPKRTRVFSLDVFRGFIILSMIFVNNGGGGYWFFEHALWHGLTFADVIFPWFMFIMGFAMVMSFRALRRNCTSKTKMLCKIIRRSVILFMLGLVVNTVGGSGPLATLRIPGVLQRFSVAFLVVGLFEMYFSAYYITPPNRCAVLRLHSLRDVLPFWPEWVFTLGVITLHTLLTFILPVPGCPTGYIGPGGLDQNSSYTNCTGGAAGYIDRVVLDASHIYGRPTCQEIYETKVPYDPEGILGACMSIVLVIFGVQAGRITHFYTTAAGRLKRFIAWGTMMGVIALLLCKASKNDGWIPVNKNLWSLSYILATGSLAFFVLSLLYLVVDHWAVWSGSPLLYPGANAVALYFGSEVLSQTFPFSWQVPHRSHAWLLFMSLWTTTMWFLVSYFMFVKKIFITV